MEKTNYLSVQDLADSENVLIQRAQKEEFGGEIKALTSQKEVPHNSKSTNPDISEEQKKPIILPADHTITKMIFKDRHQNILHCGPQALLAEIRCRYWPLRGRIIARSVLKHCVTCMRARPTFQYSLMAPLP